MDTANLRHEAEPIALKHLTISQLEAIEELTKVLSGALASSTSQETNSTSHIAILSGDKGTGKSSVMLTLKHFMDPVSDHDIDERVPGDHEKETVIKRVNRQLKGIQAKQRTVRWLQPLLLDPWAPGANLAGSILARIDMELDAMLDDPGLRGHFQRDGSGKIDNALQGLRRFMPNALLALEGNLEQMKNVLEPEPYALMTADTEHARAILREQMQRFLSMSIEGYSRGDVTQSQEGIFIQVIDDLDLRPPEVVARVLKLAAHMSNSRLFFLFLGDVNVLDMMMNFDSQGEFPTLNRSTSSPEIATFIEALSNNSSSSVVRKHIPTNQRILIRDMNIPESLRYRNNTGLGTQDVKTTSRDTTLQQLLGGFPIVPNRFLHAEAPSQMSHGPVASSAQAEIYSDWNEFSQSSEAEISAVREQLQSDKWKWSERGKHFEFRTFFARIPNLEPSATISKMAVGQVRRSQTQVYDGANTIAVTPRHVGDFYHALQEKSRKALEPIEAFLNATPDERKRLESFGKTVERSFEHPLQAVWSAFCGFVDEDGYLTIPVQRFIKEEMLQIRERWHLQTHRLTNVSIIGDRIMLSHDKESEDLRRIIGEKPSFHMAKVLRHDIAIERNDAETVTLGHRSRPAFKLLHDMLIFSDRGKPVVPIATMDGHSQHMSTQWNVSQHLDLTINWQVADWPTYWHQDLFTAIWNKFYAKIEAVMYQPSNAKASEIEQLTRCCWIYATCLTINAQPGFLVADEDAKENDPSTLLLDLKLGESGYDLEADLDDIFVQDNDENKWKINWGAFFAGDRNVINGPWSPEPYRRSLLNKVMVIYERYFRRVSEGENNIYTDMLRSKICEIVNLFSPEVGLSFGEDNAQNKTISLFDKAFGLGRIPGANDAKQHNDPKGFEKLSPVCDFGNLIIAAIQDPQHYCYWFKEYCSNPFLDDSTKGKLSDENYNKSVKDFAGHAFFVHKDGKENTPHLIDFTADISEEKQKEIFSDLSAEITQQRFRRMSEHIGHPLVLTLLAGFARGADNVETVRYLNKNSTQLEGARIVKDWMGENDDFQFDKTYVKRKIRVTPKIARAGLTLPFDFAPSRAQLNQAFFDWCSACEPNVSNYIGAKFGVTALTEKPKDWEDIVLARFRSKS